MLCIIYNYSLLLRSIPILTVHRKLNFGGTIRVFEGKYGYLLRGQITSTDFRLLLDMQKPKYCNKICDKTYYCLLLRELFSSSVVWCGIVPEPTQGQYTSPDNTIGKMFSRDKTIICLVHNIPF